MNEKLFLLIVVVWGWSWVCACTDEAAGAAGDADSDSDSDTDADSDADSDTDLNAPRHNICGDIGDTLGMGAAIFGDAGTNWVLDGAAAPDKIDWTYGYMYASGDPHEDESGFEWIVNFRLDTAESAGAGLPTVTFYRLLNVGEAFGYSGAEAEIVEQACENGDAVYDYFEDFIALLNVLKQRSTPTLVHVEPDSFGFMMWAFSGVDGASGNADAGSVFVNISGASHPALEGVSLSDDAGGLGRALLYLRNTIAPTVRMGWHASNFRVGTHPEVVTGFYSSMGAWDVIVTEPPHMVDTGSNDWDVSEPDNTANLDWLNTVSTATGLPILIWQTYVDDALPYLGAWPDGSANLSELVSNGVVGVLWDPNGNGGDCGYTCEGADELQAGLRAYSAAPLALPANHICNP